MTINGQTKWGEAYRDIDEARAELEVLRKRKREEQAKKFATNDS